MFKPPRVDRLLEDSFQLLGMAEAGLAPKFFGKRHETLGTPIRAIVVQVVVIGILAGLDFNVIMCVDNFFSAAAAALEFAAAVQLRASRPSISRPFRIPLGTNGLAAFLLLPFGISILVMVVTATHSLVSFILCISALVLGIPIAILGNKHQAARRSSMMRTSAEDVVIVAAHGVPAPSPQRITSSSGVAESSASSGDVCAAS